MTGDPRHRPTTRTQEPSHPPTSATPTTTPSCPRPTVVADGAAVVRLTSRALMDDDGLTEAGSAFSADLEATTDHAVAPVVEAVGDDLEGVTAALERWAAACIEADPRRRAAG